MSTGKLRVRRPAGCGSRATSRDGAVDQLSTRLDGMSAFPATTGSLLASRHRPALYAEGQSRAEASDDLDALLLRVGFLGGPTRLDKSDPISGEEDRVPGDC